MENEQVLTPTPETPPEAVNEDGLFSRLLARLQSAIAPAEKEAQAFTVFKGKDGQKRWIARYTNNFKDRDGEIISEKALSDYVTRVDMGIVPKPELWNWHVKGTRHGQADEVFGVGHFLYAIGHYDDNEMGRKAAEYDFKHQKEIALSHGFTAPKWAFKNGVYEVANTFEITTLPKGKESNPFTYFDEVKEMVITDEKERHLRDIYPGEVVDKIVAEAPAHGKALEEAKVEFKDFSKVTPDTATAKPDSSIAEMYLETSKAQGELASLLIAYKKSVDSQIEALKSELQTKEQTHQKAIEGYTAEVSELRKAVNAGPRAASESPSTVVDKKEVDALKAKAPNADDTREQARKFMFSPGGQ